MCCCNEPPEITFVDEEGDEVYIRYFEKTDFDVLGIRASQGWDEEVQLTFVVRRKDDGT